MVHHLLVQKLREFIDDDDLINEIVDEFEFIGYARLSREDSKKDKSQDSSSIVRQKETFKGYGIDKVFWDDGKSGSMDDEEEIKVYRSGSKLIAELEFKKRPDFVKLLEHIEKGECISCVSNWDRLARSVIAQEISLIYAKQNNSFIMSLHEGNESIVRVVLGILAQKYIETQKGKMNDSSETKFNLGLYNGRVKLFGYRWIEVNSYKTLVACNDDDTFLIMKLFDMAESKSVNDIRNELNLDYGFVKNNLSNVYHAGFLKHHKKDVFKRGTHVGIVGLDKFIRVQRKLGNDVLADSLSKFI